MNAPLQKSRLGRGLASLIGDAPITQPRIPPEGEQRMVAIEQIRAGKLNPRKTFKEDELTELADSIRLANDRLDEHIPDHGTIRVVDEALTAGVPEFREGAGFHDMVHTTPAGAQLLAARVVAELTGWLGG